MKRMSLIITIIMILLSSLSNLAFANSGNSAIQIDIISPSNVRDYPGHEDKIVAKIKNNGNTDITDVLAYITMADLGKNMTVNLEDYSADKPISIDVLKSGEEKTIELPIRFVYTSNYHLYVTLVSKNNSIISSSNAIPIEILGNTKINKPLAMGVAFIEPLLLLAAAVTVYGLRRKKFIIS